MTFPLLVRHKNDAPFSNESGTACHRSQGVLSTSLPHILDQRHARRFSPKPLLLREAFLLPRLFVWLRLFPFYSKTPSSLMLLCLAGLSQHMHSTPFLRR